MSSRDRIWFGVVIGIAVLAVVMETASVRGEFVFGAASLALMGLAWLLGEATDQAGNTAGPRTSALLNATFGNLPEVVIVILAINAGLDDIARASIIGSVIGNVLLILGLSLIVGGWKNGIQSFNEKVAATNSSMLILGVAGLGLPTLFAALHSSESADTLSIWTGAALLVCYGGYLLFTFSMPGQTLEDEPGSARWSTREAVVALAVTAVATGVVSEVLVDSIKPTVEQLGIPRPFVGLILVPFVGNVAEHFSAVRLAYRNRVDFSMAIAFGSGIQIALGASGIAVFSSILLGGDELSLVFDPLQIAALGAAALVATLVARGGETNWLEGLQLIVIYLIVAVAVWLS